jgi:hypothetical protein
MPRKQRRPGEPSRERFIRDNGRLDLRILQWSRTGRSTRESDSRVARVGVTPRVFLGQVLSADPSCPAAVAGVIVHRVSQGLRPCSSETGAYCQARKRLFERFFSIVAFLVGRKLDASVDSQWLWKGRRVYLFYGSTVSRPVGIRSCRGGDSSLSSIRQLSNSTIKGNQAVGGTGGAGANGGDGLGGGIAIIVDSSATVSAADIENNNAFGGNAVAGGSTGQGIGGGVFNMGTFVFDAATVIKKNHASTSNDNLFA